MSKYQPYPQYKDSGVAWLGKIPKEWNSIKFKHVFREKKKKTDLMLDCGSISFGEVVYKDNDKIPEETKAAYQEVLIGEFLVNPLNLNFDLKSLRTALSNINVVVSTGYIVLQSQNDMNKNYLRWLLYQFDIAHMKTLGAGVRQTVNFTDIGNEYFYMPSLKEQQAIANFLDNATCKIDTLIQKQQNLIELLKEKRQALISHTVTKGLNPHVKMKDSGVEWLGEVPEHWEVKRLKFVASYKNSNIDKKSYENQKQVRLCNYTDVYYNENITNDIEFMIATASDSEINAMSLKKGDIIITKDSENPADIGIPAIVTEELDNTVCGYHLTVIGANCDMDSFYLYRTIQSSMTKAYLHAETPGITRYGLKQDTIGSILVVCPPYSEQQTIANYLDNATCKINTLIAKAQQAIELLKERKTALISATVTGKIDVRECVGDNSNRSEIPNSSNQR